MRISDWSSDVCSSDLDLWGRGDSVSVSVQSAPRRPKDGTVVSGNYLTRVGKVQLLAYGVYSDSDIAVVGGTSVIGKGKLFGTRAIVPLSQSEGRSEEHTSELQSLMRISYAVFCLKKKNTTHNRI